MEVLSPGSQHQDMHRKLMLCDAFGVREYWIASPEFRRLYRHVRAAAGALECVGDLGPTDRVEAAFQEGMSLALREIFPEDEADEG